MNRKIKVVMAYFLSLVMVLTSFLEFVVPAKAADTGFAENAVIVSDKAVEYCWLDSTVNLSVTVIKGTSLEWSIDRANEGVSLTEAEDVEDRTGIIKNLSVAIGTDASGSYKITANVGNDSRTITLNVCNSLSDIQGVVVTDFANQYTENTFEVKAVVDPRYADTFEWSSADATKVEVKAEEDKTSTTEYAGSVVKYAMVNIKSEKPQDGVCDITATANSLVKAQTLRIRKSATNLKDLTVTATSYQKEYENFDLVTYNHMSSDALYVDMEETITLTCVVEGTLVNSELPVGASLSLADVDDSIGISSTQTDVIALSHVQLTKLSDTSYQVQFDLTGAKVTNIQNPIVFNVVTDSGKRSIRRNLIVLAPAMNTEFLVKNPATQETSYIVTKETNVGIFDDASGKDELPAGVSLNNFDALWQLSFTNTSPGYTFVKVAQNYAQEQSGSAHTFDMTAGSERDLTAVFRSRFQVNSKENQKGAYICASTDTPLWKSSDETIATVTQSGVIKAVKGGNARIYCYAAPTKTSPRTNIFAYVDVHVTNLTEAEGVNITKEINGEQKVIAEDTIYTSQKNVQYSAQLINGSTTANEPVMWESSDTNIFEVGSDTGIVNPKKEGTATLTVTTQKSGYQASIRITVKAAIEKIKIPEGDYVGTYVQNHTYALSTELNNGELINTEEAITWTLEDQNENDPVVVFVDPKDSEEKELTKFVGANVNIKIKKRGSAKVVVKGAVNASAIDTLNVTAISERPATNTTITYNNESCDGKEINVEKGKNVELKASLLAENGSVSTDDFYWEIEQEGDIVKAANSSLKNVNTLTLQPVTKGDAIVTLRDVQTNKFLTVTIHVRVPATDISLKETQQEIMLVPGEATAVGVTYQLKPTLTPADTSDTVVYESSDPSIVKVDENGLLTAVKSSETPVTITAKINDELKATCQVRVAIPITEISATDHKGQTVENKGTINVYVGSTGAVVLNCGNATEYVNWVSKNETIASVMPSKDTYSCTINGNVAGTTILTAESTVSKKTMEFTVNVVNKIAGISLNGNTNVAYGTSNAYINAVVTPNTNFDEIIWSVDKKDVLEVTPIRQGNTVRALIVPKKPGTATVTATSGDGMVSDKLDVTITAIDISRITVQLEQNSYPYDGKAHTPKVTVKNGQAELKEGIDYKLSYKDNVNAGSAAVVISGGTSGCYTGTREIRYTITKRTLDNVAVKLSAASFDYTGAAIIPKVTVTDLGKTLKEGTDYSVFCMNNTNVGTATIRINAVGTSNYQGMKDLTFQIKAKDLSKVKVASIAAQTYTGNALTPALTVTNGQNALFVNRDYTVKYSSNKNTGKAKAVLTGTGNYTGKKTVYFYIAPAVPKDISVTSTAAKTLKIKWKKDSKATGYEIYYGTNSKFTKKTRKVVDIKKYRTTSKTVKKLKSGKTYYVKMRAYKKVGSKKVYGPWSTTYQTIIQ